MPGDYSRFSDQPLKRFSALLMQQGRVQVDADWNELVAILRRRIEVEANDTFGQAAVPRVTTPNGFLIGYTNTNNVPDLSIAPGRIYVDGILAECFAADNASYAQQPFWLNPPALSGIKGDVLVYLDVWQRELTAVEEPSVLDSALNNDTGTRLQTVWQVKLAPPAPNTTVTCSVDFSKLFPPSAGQLSTQTVPPSQAPDPCTMPDSGGYQGVDNRFYRVVIHDPIKQLVKWSRDNGSVCTTVSTLTNGVTSTLTVARVGRDDDLGFRVNDWVEVIDDVYELGGKAGVMANVTVVDPVGRTLTLDRNISAAGFDPSGKNRLRVRRWDQQAGVDPTTGLLSLSGGGWVTLENGIQVQLTVASGGPLYVGDAWAFAARASDGTVETLSKAPPIAIVHHYCSLATVKGLGGGTAPTLSDCRVWWPPISDGGADCECAVCVNAADHNSGKATLQQAIEQAKKVGGAVCLGPGTFELGATGLTLSSAAGVHLRGAGSATVLHYSGTDVALAIVGSVDVGVSDLEIQCDQQGRLDAVNQGCIRVQDSVFVTIERSALATTAPTQASSYGISLQGYVAASRIRDNFVVSDYGLITLSGLLERRIALTNNPSSTDGDGFYDIVVSGNLFTCTRAGIYWFAIGLGEIIIADNAIGGTSTAGILVSGAVVGAPVRVLRNDVGTTGSGIGVRCNEFEVLDNTILGAATSNGGGETVFAGVWVQGSNQGWLVRAAVERNRIYGFQTGYGVYVDGDVSRLTVRGNSIEQVGAGIVMDAESTALDLLVESNEISNVGTQANNGIDCAGIVANRPARAAIRSNTLALVGSGITAGAPITGIRVVGFGLATIADNEIDAIGSLTSTTSASTGIEVVGPFNEARVRSNRITVQAPSTFSGSLLHTAIIIVAGLQDIADPKRKFIIKAVNSEVLFITPKSYAVMPVGQQDVELAANVVQVVPSSQPLVSVVVGGATVCRGNRVAIVTGLTPTNDPQSPPPATFVAPAVEIYAGTLIASDNQVNAYKGPPGMSLATPQNGRTTVLGNICTTGITLGGTQLGGVWQPLNIEA